MTTPIPNHRGRPRAVAVAVVLAAISAMVALAPAAVAVPIEGTGGTGPGTSPVETIEVIRTVTETVSAGVPYLAVVAIGLLAFVVAWVLATYVAGHRAHRSAMG